MKNIRELRCWVLSIRLESMLDRYMEDGCTFDLTVTQLTSSLGPFPWRKLYVDLGEGAKVEELDVAVEWLKAATHDDVILINY